MFVFLFVYIVLFCFVCLFVFLFISYKYHELIWIHFVFLLDWVIKLYTCPGFKKKKKKKKRRWFKSARCPLLCNFTRPQHTLQMFADHCGPRQTIPWETINHGLLQPQGELYPIQTIFNHRRRDQLLEFRTSFYETIIAVSSLSKGFSSTLNFHESIATDGTRTRNLSHPKRAPCRLS